MRGKSFTMYGMNNMEVINSQQERNHHSLQDNERCALDDIVMMGKSFTILGMKDMKVINYKQAGIINHSL
jgi:hypothetical protein